MYFICLWCSINIRVHAYLPSQINPQQNSKEKIPSKNAKKEFEAFSTWNYRIKYLKWIIGHIPAKLSLFRTFEGRNIKIYAPFCYSFLLSSGKRLQERHSQILIPTASFLCWVLLKWSQQLHLSTITTEMTEHST